MGKLDITNISGGGTKSLLERRFNLNYKVDDNMAKTWNKILDFTFSDSGIMPEEIDVSKYTEFFISVENLINKSTVDSSLNLKFGEVIVKMETVKKGTASMCQQAHLINNGLFLEQYVFPRCTSNINVYSFTYSNITSPYTRKLHPTLSPLTFGINANDYNLIAGTITIYAR